MCQRCVCVDSGRLGYCDEICLPHCVPPVPTIFPSLYLQNLLFFYFIFQICKSIFSFFYFLCPKPNTCLQFRIYIKSRCDKKCPFPQFLISFICFEIIILEFLQHDDWGQIDQIFSASYLGKHCQMLKIDIYPSYVPELILKNILSTVSRTFLEKNP